MAEIKNGFLISARSKVGGTVLYRAKGEQLMRGVPVYPADYVGSAAQVQARDLFGDVSRYATELKYAIDEIGSYEHVIGRRYRGTYRDQLIGRAFGNLFRGEAGEVLPSNEQAERISFLNNNPGVWLLRNVAVPKFRQVRVPRFYVSFSSNGKGGVGAILEWEDEEMIAALIRLRQSGYARVTTSQFGVLAFGTNWSDTGPVTNSPGIYYKANMLTEGSKRMNIAMNKEVTYCPYGGVMGIVVYCYALGTSGPGVISVPTTIIPLMSFFSEDSRLFL